MIVAGVKLSGHAIVDRIQPRVEASAKTATSHAEWRKDVADERAIVADTDPFVRALRKAIEVTFGESPDALLDFGLVPPRRRRGLTGTELVQRAAKAKATRVLRHTQGKRERKGVKAVETPTVILGPPKPVGGAPPASVANGATAGTTTAAGTK
jgi:hypothetical protein